MCPIPPFRIFNLFSWQWLTYHLENSSEIYIYINWIFCILYSVTVICYHRGLWATTPLGVLWAFSRISPTSACCALYFVLALLGSVGVVPCPSLMTAAELSLHSTSTYLLRGLQGPVNGWCVGVQLIATCAPAVHFAVNLYCGCRKVHDDSRQTQLGSYQAH